MNGHIRSEDEDDYENQQQQQPQLQQQQQQQPRQQQNPYSGSRKSLTERLQALEVERDELTNNLREQVKQTTHYGRLSKDLEHKCETYEDNMEKLRKDHQDLQVKLREFDIRTSESL